MNAVRAGFGVMFLGVSAATTALAAPMTRSLLVHPDEFTDKWIDRAVDIGLDVLAMHPTGGGNADRSLANLLELCRQPEFRARVDRAIAKGLTVEYECHAGTWLLPRELFGEHPEYFRMDESGKRVQKINFCPSSAEALEIVARRARELARGLYRSSSRHYFWLDDVSMDICKCPECSRYSASDLQLKVFNRILAELRKDDPKAQLAFLAYCATLRPPTKVKPAEGIFLEYAPIGRKWDRPAREQPVVDAKGIRELLDCFGRKDARVLEYWYDNSLFSRWTKPPKKFAVDADVLRTDVAWYRELGFETIASFACFLGDDYEKLWGVPDVGDFSLKSLAEPSAWSSVEFRDCPKCERRFKVDLSAGKAYVNASRVAEKDRERVAARAALCLARARAPVNYDERLCPLMGWSSWNSFGVGISEEIIVSVARAMATNGLAQAGYRYVNIDDGFFGGRDANGGLKFHPKRFPNGLKPTVDAIHALGLRAGIYSDAGSDTCGSMWGDGSGGKDELGRGSGLYRHDADDCRLHFRDIGFDFIKVDFCGGNALKLDERRRYSEIAEAIRTHGRADVRLNACRWAYPGTWISDVAGSWRVTGDIRASWRSVRDIIAESFYLSAYASPGHFNDMDMLEVGQVKGAVKSTFGAADTGLSDDEEVAHFGMWCMMSSPLLIGCDVRTIRPASLRLVTNPYLIRMSQNRGLGLQGRVVARQGEAYVLAKDADEPYGLSRYVALYNANDREHEFRVNAADLELAGEVEAFDLVDCSDVGAFEDHVYVRVPAHAARFFRMDAERRIERRVYEAEDAFLTDYQELRDAKKAGTAHPAQVGRASNGVAVRNLGGRETNDLVWKDVRIVRGGRRALEIFCESEKDAEFALGVDGRQVRRLSARRSHGSFAPVAVELELAPGVHELRLSNAAGPMPDVDVMIVR